MKFMPIKYYETFLSASNKQHINLSYVIEASTHGELSVNVGAIIKTVPQYAGYTTICFRLGNLAAYIPTRSR